MSSPSKSMYHHHTSMIQNPSSSVPDSYVMNSNSYHAPHPQQQQQHYNMNTAQRGSSSRPNVQTYPHHKLYNPPPQHQPWRPMAPNNVAKIRYPPPPPPPPPPSNGRSASSTGYRGGGGGISTHYSNMNSNHHHLNNNIVSNNSNAVTPHLKNYQHSNSSPPNSSTTSSMVKGSGGSGAPVLMQQYYQQQTSSSSSYPPPPHTHQQQALHTPQQPAHRRIITNLNAAQQSSGVNRRLDMSPESNKDTYHSSHGEFSSTTSRMQVVTQQTQQQQQQSGQLNNKNTNRRRSSGTGQLAIKRSDQAPVTLKGWLFKQGSDGLMLWKKRWFVLSEFCLFYYRSSDEDKVSGSILLPSYRISPVIKEDGVVYHKKYTFKAEHHNMRTYFFAAETKDSMIQWMNALSLASILQQHQELKMNPPVVLPPSSNQQQQSQQLQQQQQQQQRSYIVKQQTPPQSSSSTNHNSVKVIQHHPPAVYQMFNSNGTAYVPAALTTTSSSSKVINYNTNNIGNNNSSNNSMNGPQDIENGGIQPLYANAPPKPARRLNSSRDYSPDSDSERGMMNTPYLQQPQNSTLQWPNPQPSSTQSRLPLERRTPEAYARSQNHQIFHHKNGDYEDPSLMTRPPFPNYRLSQNRLNDPRYMDNSFSPFSVNENTTPTISNNNNIGFSPTKQRTQRPHSADFLEYDKSMIHHPRSTQDDQVITNNRRRSGGQNSQPPRPKSSIDQPRMFKNEEEFHLWSEESYAQKMREQQQLLHHQQQVFSTNPNSRSQSRMSFARESNFNDSEAEVEKYFPTPMPRTPKNNSYIHPSNSNNQYQNLPLPPSTSSSQNTPMSYNSHGSEVRLDAITPNRLSEMGIMMNDPLNEDNGEFKGSSSARLPRQRRNGRDTLPNEDPKKKDQEISKLFFQREESMKRLLEWKQRMLQSPLTRKSSRNASRTQTPTNSTSPIPSAFVFAPSSHDYIKQKVLEEFDKQDISSSHSLTSHHRSFHISSSSSEKRLSRKGSSGSRSSRSRSSPRFGSRRDLSSSDEDEEDHRDQRQHRRRVNSTSQKRHQESVIASNKKIQENIWDLSSQDLLGKSHEELVLILIHLRRQSAALTEAIDASTAELENITNSNDQSYLLVEDLRNHIRDLEEQQARGRPIVSLVDNMVKLGTLYRGPEGAPLSHRLRNIPATSIQDEEISRESSTTKQRRADIQELLQRSLEVVRQNINEDKQLSKEERDSLVEERKVLENELSRVTNELETCQKKLDECSSDHARWEHDVLFLRQKLQASASRDMSYGLGQSAETLLVENELAQVQQRASELHKTRQVIQSNVDSLTKRPASASVPLSNVRNKWQGHENLPGLGDDNQIDPEQSKKVNSQSTLLSSSKGIESKTVRMVKRDSKERSYKNEGEELVGYVGIEGSSNEVTPKFNVSSSSPPPPPLPRGNYENLHDFLKSDSSTILNDSKDELASKRQQMPRTSSTTAGLGTSGPTSTGIDSKFFSSSSYKMMDMFKTNSKKDERPSSSLSAHERLFGSSRDNSMSPPISPQILGSKVGSSSGGESLSSSFSANSPIFKSAAAKAIIQEVGGSAASHRRLKKRDKKRSYTITGGSSSSAVIEALNDHAARACDDLDMERVLRGSSRPNAPDVVKSTLDKKDAKINPSSIDNLFGVPDKIIIPERYIPEADIDNLSREERQVRLKKADSIRRMLTENASTTDEHQNKEEKKQRERLLSLNQVLAREVMEKSRLVAGQSRMKQ